MWEDLDDDEDVVRDYRMFDGHRDDITSMAAYPPRALLATGDYEGRITIWQLFTGEKRMCLFHRCASSTHAPVPHTCSFSRQGRTL